MKKLLALLPIVLILSCTPSEKKTEDYKIPVYGWLGGPGDKSDEEIKAEFIDL